MEHVQSGGLDATSVLEAFEGFFDPALFSLVWIISGNQDLILLNKRQTTE
jgi:hypothetical protein